MSRVVLNLPGLEELTGADGFASAKRLGKLLVPLVRTGWYCGHIRHEESQNKFYLHEIAFAGKCFSLWAHIEKIGFVGCCWQIAVDPRHDTPSVLDELVTCERVPITLEAVPRAVAKVARAPLADVLERGWDAMAWRFRNEAYPPSELFGRAYPEYALKTLG